jgi:lysophospholipase L1-like esterase
MVKLSKSSVQNLSLLAIALILGLLFSEVLLRSLTQFPLGLTSRAVPHETLLYVLDPDLPEVDPLGFRNREGPDNKPIFSIGDSHTFGHGVGFDQSWPMQLQKTLGLGVYNLGISGYNIYQYYGLFEIAKQYSPKYVIIGFYPTNDLGSDTCEALRLDYWNDKISQWGLSKGYCDHEYIQRGARSQFTEFLKKNVALLNAADHLIWNPILKYIKSIYGEKNTLNPFYLKMGNTTFQVSRNRAKNESESSNLENQRVIENFKNSKKIFEQIKNQANQNKISLLILVIPSKQRVLNNLFNKHRGEIPLLLNNLVKNEDILIEEYLKFFNEQSIPAIDATDHMVAVVEENMAVGVRAYPDDDGHPLAAGYTGYAKAALELFVALRDHQ